MGDAALAKTALEKEVEKVSETLKKFETLEGLKESATISDDAKQLCVFSKSKMKFSSVQLAQLFAPFGGCEVVNVGSNSTSTLVGIVRMDTHESAVLAQKALNDTDAKGFVITGPLMHANK